jgi:hypothetical protein
MLLKSSISKYGQLFAGPDRVQRLLVSLAKQYAVGQVGQCIVVHHMGDLCLGARSLGDVLDRRHPAARLQRLVDDFDRPSARRLRELTRRLPERDVTDDGIAEPALPAASAVLRSNWLPSSIVTLFLHGMTSLRPTDRKQVTTCSW